MVMKIFNKFVLNWPTYCERSSVTSHSGLGFTEKLEISEEEKWQLINAIK